MRSASLVENPGRAAISAGSPLGTGIIIDPSGLILTVNYVVMGGETIHVSFVKGRTQRAEIVCFPEAYLPGLRGQDFDVWPFDQQAQDRALKAVADWARSYRVAVILGMERLTPAGRQIAGPWSG